jgi:hypothetical protein
MKKVISLTVCALWVATSGLLSLGAGGCGGSGDEPAIDGSSTKTSPSGTGGGTGATGASDGGGDILPSGETTGATAEGTTGDSTAGGTTGGEEGGTTAGEATTGGGTTGGIVSDTPELAEPPLGDFVAPTVVSVTPVDSEDSVILKIKFSEAVDMAVINDKKSIILWNEAQLVGAVLAAIFTLGAVDPIEASTIPATYATTDDPKTVMLIATSANVKNFKLKDNSGVWKSSPYHLRVFAADSTPASTQVRKAKDMAGNALEHNYDKELKCQYTDKGEIRGDIPCGEVVKVGETSE